jgi:hypothetical protein
MSVLDVMLVYVLYFVFKNISDFRKHFYKIDMQVDLRSNIRKTDKFYYFRINAVSKGLRRWPAFLLFGMNMKSSCL